MPLLGSVQHSTAASSFSMTMSLLRCIVSVSGILAAAMRTNPTVCRPSCSGASRCLTKEGTSAIEARPRPPLRWLSDVEAVVFRQHLFNVAFDAQVLCKLAFPLLLLFLLQTLLLVDLSHPLDASCFSLAVLSADFLALEVGGMLLSKARNDRHRFLDRFALQTLHEGTRFGCPAHYKSNAKEGANVVAGDWHWS